MRKMIHDVLYTLLTNEPVVSHFELCAKLAFQNENLTPLTSLDLQRQFYNEVKTKNVSELNKMMFENGLVEVDTFERHVLDAEVLSE